MRDIVPFSRTALAVAVAVAIGGTAHAQTDDTTVEEVIVTGSLLRNVTGMSTPTPVTAVTSTEMAALAPTTMIAALSQLPQFLGNTTNDVRGNYFSSPGSGNLNMRALNTGGSGRTLTLLDGRRVVPANGFGSVDINILPSALVQRIETVTGGASAAYGTDAVAGAVNFILNTDYTGWEASVQTGSTAESDRDNRQISVAFGTPIGERLHLLLSGEYFQADGITSVGERDWYKGYSLINNPDTSSSAPRYLLRPNVVSAVATHGGLINSGVPTTSALYRMHFQPDGSLAPFVLGEGTATHAHSITNGGSGDDTTANLISLAPEAERSSTFAYLSFDATPKLNLYLQGLRGTSMTDAPDHGGRFAAVPGIDTRLTIFRENAFLPAAVAEIMDAEGLTSFQMNVVGDREGLGRSSRLKQDNETTSATAGFKWDVTDEWQLTGYAQSGKADNRGYQEGILMDRVIAAIDAVEVDGNIVCRAATIDPEKWGDCVPLNLFGRGNASDAAIAYVTNFTPGQHITSPLFFQPDEYESGKTVSYTSGVGKVYNTETRQTIVDVSASGKVADGWAGPIAAAFGASWRKEEIEQIVWDPSNPASDPSIFPASPALAPALRAVPPYIATRSSMVQNSTVANVHGEYEVKEVFTEWQLPLLRDKRGAQDLSLLVAGRAAEYTGSGNIWSWKWGVDWQVYSDLRIRGTVSQDIRAATLLERFNQTGGIGTVNRDPMFPDDGTQTISTRTGGNPNLNPETSKTYTYGVVYQPSGLEGFSVSVDYWDVDISGAIGLLGFQRIVDDCFNGAANVCSLVTRDPVTNRLAQVRNITQNIAAAAGRGVDLELGYRLPNVGVRLFWSHMLENSTMTDRSNPATYFDSVGQTGVGNLPEDAVTAIVTYNRGKFFLSPTLRYISSGIYNKRYNLPNARPDVEDNTVPSVVYVNLSGGYSWDLGDGRLEFFANVQNLFDKDPPVVPTVFDASLGQTGGIGTNASLFDVFGRRFTIGVTFRH